MRADDIVRKVKEKGYFLREGMFTSSEVATINSKIDTYLEKNLEGVVMESGGNTVRGIHGLHLYDEFFKEICSDQRLLTLAEKFIGEHCYVHQFKINMKQKLQGQFWPWHQDFIFWKKGDGLEKNNLVNIGVYLGDVDLIHGPLCFIPYSHRYGNLCSKTSNADDWQNDLSHSLTYQVGEHKLGALLEDNPAEFVTGKAGSLLIFDSQTVHCSSVNMSPYNRPLMIITYNAVSNAPKPTMLNQRPEFLCARDFEPFKTTTNREF